MKNFNHHLDGIIPVTTLRESLQPFLGISFFLGWGDNESTWYISHYRPLIMDDDDCGAVGGMSGRGNRSIRRKSVPVPLCPPQIPHGLTWAWTQAATMGNQRLNARATSCLIFITKCSKQKWDYSCILILTIKNRKFIFTFSLVGGFLHRVSRKKLRNVVYIVCNKLDTSCTDRKLSNYITHEQFKVYPGYTIHSLHCRGNGAKKAAILSTKYTPHSQKFKAYVAHSSVLCS
jgi:hypothetical protein